MLSFLRAKPLLRKVMLRPDECRRDSFLKKGVLALGLVGTVALVCIDFGVSQLAVAGEGSESKTQNKKPTQFRFSQGNIFVVGKQVSIKRGDELAASAPPSGPVIDDKAYFLNRSKWDNNVIYVCWENPDVSNEEERSEVKQAVEETWQKRSSLKLKSWGTCPTQFVGIRIKIADEGPHTKGLGKALAGKQDGMVLNFTYEKWGAECQAKRSLCNISIAVHEFGHALGFAHEQNRPDTPGECALRAQGPNGDNPLTSWDEDSVMNYCNPVYNNDGKLSQKDIIALQKVYGKPRAQ